MIRVTKIDNFEELSGWKTKWDELLAESESDYIFLTWAWISCWWNVFGPQHRLYVLFAESEGKLIGIAPLMQTDRKRGVCLEFIGTPDADYTDFIFPRGNGEVVAAFIDFLNANRGDWDSIRLTQVPDSSPSLEPLRSKLAASNPRHQIETSDICPAFIYDGSGDTHRSQFVMKKGKAIRNSINRFRKEGDLELKLLRGHEALAEHLPTLINYHIRRWQDTDTPSRFLSPDHRRFCIDMISQPGLEEHVLVIALMFKQLPIGYFLCFDYGGKISLYTPAHDETYNKRSPGQILNYFLIEHLVREGYDCIDFMRGGEQYKQRYTNRIRTNVRIEIVTRTLDYLQLRLRQKAKTLPLARTIHQFLNR